MKRRRPAVPITNPAFAYAGSATHTDAAAFALRQMQRRERIQAKPAANVAAIKVRRTA